MLTQGWGSYPKINAQIHSPQNNDEIIKILKSENFITRGMGKSYGDSSLANNILSTLKFNQILSFDKKNGILIYQSGVTLSKILDLILKDNWFLPVTPGTSYVTIGGCLASDVHGKNHHIEGAISEFIDSFTILLGNGEILECSRKNNNDLFFATCGGMGLTGIILTLQIKLKKITSGFIKNENIKNRSIGELISQIEVNKNKPYSVAWIDTNRGTIDNFKSILYLGEHNYNNFNSFKKKRREFSINNNFPSFLLNNYSMKIFNQLFYLKQKQNHKNVISLKEYFYPLDVLSNWNNLYGKRGFIQYQFVIPKENIINNLKKIFDIFSKNYEYSFLTTLKSMGNQNKNHLSFPKEGYTVAQDFKFNNNLPKLIKYVDSMIADFGGRIYLTKDALLSEKIFKKTYQKWYEFENIRSKYFAVGKFQSLQSKRIGLQ